MNICSTLTHTTHMHTRTHTHSHTQHTHSHTQHTHAHTHAHTHTHTHTLKFSTDTTFTRQKIFYLNRGIQNVCSEYFLNEHMQISGSTGREASLARSGEPSGRLAGLGLPAEGAAAPAAGGSPLPAEPAAATGAVHSLLSSFQNSKIPFPTVPEPGIFLFFSHVFGCREVGIELP